MNKEDEKDKDRREEEEKKRRRKRPRKKSGKRKIRKEGGLGEAAAVVARLSRKEWTTLFEDGRKTMRLKFG